MRTPGTVACKSLSRNGTPHRGPSGSPAAIARRAYSSIGITTAFRRGFCFSSRSTAASSSAVGVASPLRTSSARPIAS